jgi:hypothetical protein
MEVAMTVIGITYWNRRDGADRALLGSAALDVCKALKSSDAVDDIRFYWSGPDTVVLQMFAPTAGPMMTPPNADAARAMFALADLANRERFEQWMDPRTGWENYQLAGR